MNIARSDKLRGWHVLPGLLLAGVLLAACSAPDEETEALVGVEPEDRVLYVGVLSDESGPAASLGRPYAVGFRVLVHQINRGDSELLPEGWRIRLVERDVGYDAERAVTDFEQIQDRVLFFGSIFGTPPLSAVAPLLEERGIVGFPTSGNSQLLGNQYTPVTWPTYDHESMRLVDWMVAEGGQDAAIAVVYQDDDYGLDSLTGMRQAAEHHGIEIATEQAYRPGQRDFTELVQGLEDAGAGYVLMATLPSATLPILQTAAESGYNPVWAGNFPSWTDDFFRLPEGTRALFNDYHLATPFPYWGEDTAFMNQFMEAFEAYTRDRVAVPPNTYTLLAYIQSVVALEAFARALSAGDLTRPGYLRALQGIDDFDVYGALDDPLNYSSVPYDTGARTRILRPRMDNGDWAEVSPTAQPQAAN